MTPPTMRSARATSSAGVEARVAGLDWGGLTERVDAAGFAQSDELLSADECAELVACYQDEGRFRATIDMTRHQFGSGQYRYFSYPLPELIARLRYALYPRLLPIARDWAARLGSPSPWPDTLDDWLSICHRAGQAKPTPILLRYTSGDWNALHRDLYGDLVFPLQVVIGLDRPGREHTGGEFLMVEQRPRAQSRGYATTIKQGHALVFTTRDRPVETRRGWSRAPTRHGVSTVLSGHRHTLGLLFHDAA